MSSEYPRLDHCVFLLPGWLTICWYCERKLEVDKLGILIIIAIEEDPSVECDSVSFGLSCIYLRQKHHIWDVIQLELFNIKITTVPVMFCFLGQMSCRWKCVKPLYNKVLQNRFLSLKQFIYCSLSYYIAWFQ